MTVCPFRSAVGGSSMVRHASHSIAPAALSGNRVARMVDFGVVFTASCSRCPPLMLTPCCRSSTSSRSSRRNTATGTPVAQSVGGDSGRVRHNEGMTSDDRGDQTVVVSAFYKFVALDDHVAFRDRLLSTCDDAGMRGSILLASEGINGTVAGSRVATDTLFAWLRGDSRLADLQAKESFTEDMPFLRMKVRLKKEIVTFRQPVDPTARVGTYVRPADWNAVISDPEVLVIDTRNEEEVSLGTFENAVDPGTESFTEFADYVATLRPEDHPRVAMFCTGGIRCEKASSYMLDQGFAEVMHLQGGILQYLEDVEPAESLWRGECFVFDERVTVDHDLQPGDFTLCRGCRTALSHADRQADSYEEGVCCAACSGELTEERAARLRERHRQVLLAEQRGDDHLARKA